MSLKIAQNRSNKQRDDRQKAENLIEKGAKFYEPSAVSPGRIPKHHKPPQKSIKTNEN
jgi:hypothetical protein